MNEIYKNMNYAEQREAVDILATWLRTYTKDCINYVMQSLDKVLGNEVAMKMLKELHKREAEEARDFRNSIACLAGNFDGFSEYDPHNHALTHSKSYRNVLYDMFIEPMHDEKEEQ